MIAFSRTLLLLALFGLSLAGCSTPRQIPRLSDEQVRQRWLASIADGRTTRKDVQQLLGDPAYRFSSDRIFGYRFVLAHRGTEPSDEDYQNESNWRGKYEANNDRRRQIAEVGSLMIIRDSNEESYRKLILLREAEFGLLLVFDESGVLAQHKFSRINRE